MSERNKPNIKVYSENKEPRVQKSVLYQNMRACKTPIVNEKKENSYSSNTLYK